MDVLQLIAVGYMLISPTVMIIILLIEGSFCTPPSESFFRFGECETPSKFYGTSLNIIPWWFVGMIVSIIILFSNIMG